MEQRISKLSLDKGNKFNEGHGGLPRKKIFFGVVCGKEKKRRRKCEEFVSSYVCKNQVWKECVQESSMGRVCV